MSTLAARVKSWLLSVVKRNRVEAEMEEEIRFHLEARAADLMRDGLDAREAMRRAHLEFGAIAAHKAGMRSSLGLRWWDELWGDLRYAARILRKSPGFTAIAVGSLALAIGANTTIFSVANELLYERLGVPHPEQLRLLEQAGDDHMAIHRVWGGNNDTLPDGRWSLDCFTYPVYQQLRKHNRVMEDIFAFKDIGHANVTVDGKASALYVQLVSGNYYPQMRVQPALGRTILPADDGSPGTGAVAVISNQYWTSGFGRSLNVIGKVIRVDTTLVTIVGVNPPEFTGANSVQGSPEIFMPISILPLLRGESGEESFLTDPDIAWVRLMARVKPGVPAAQVQSAMDVALSAAIRGTVTLEKGDTIPQMAIEDGSRGSNALGQEYARPLAILLVMTGFLLLLACANLANLMLARASARQREMGVRLALGAGRWRILRQVLTESLLLSAIGGALGLLLAYFGRTAIPNMASWNWHSTPIHVPFNWKIFAFTGIVTVGTAVFFGVAPASASMRTEIDAALKLGSKTASRRRRAFSGKAIIAFQIALSTILVVGAALFLRTIVNLNSVDPGFRTDDLILFGISLPENYLAAQKATLNRQLEESLAGVPGVEGVTLADIPLLAGIMSNRTIHFEGLTDEYYKGMDRSPYVDDVGQNFFQVMGIPILAGRGFTAQDTATSRRVALINRTMARKYFPNQNPIGKRFSHEPSTAPQRKWIEIIGICGDTHYDSLRDDPPATFFELYRQREKLSGATYIVRTRMKPEAIVPSLRAVVQRIDSSLPLVDIRTQREQIDFLTQEERMFASLTAGFGLLALALACVGIYGIMAYTVSQRTNEIGIRLALGAERGQVRGMVLREAGWLAVIGVSTGIAVALALGRLVATMLYGLKAADPVSLTGAAFLLLLVALAAGWVPAMRASSVEPMQALRHE
jgi:predicted permease